MSFWTTLVSILWMYLCSEWYFKFVVHTNLELTVLPYIDIMNVFIDCLILPIFGFDWKRPFSLIFKLNIFDDCFAWAIPRSLKNYATVVVTSDDKVVIQNSNRKIFCWNINAKSLWQNSTFLIYLVLLGNKAFFWCSICRR